MPGTASPVQPAAPAEDFVPHAGMSPEEAATFLAKTTYPDSAASASGAAEVSWLNRKTDQVVADGYFGRDYTFLVFVDGPRFTDAAADHIRGLVAQLRLYF